MCPGALALLWAESARLLHPYQNINAMHMKYLVRKIALARYISCSGLELALSYLSNRQGNTLVIKQPAESIGWYIGIAFPVLQRAAINF